MLASKVWHRSKSLAEKMKTLRKHSIVERSSDLAIKQVSANFFSKQPDSK